MIRIQSAQPSSLVPRLCLGTRGVRRLLLFLPLLLVGCQQQMAQQPSYRPLEPSDFFTDGRSARPLVPGTVARGQRRDDPHLYAGTNQRRAAVPDAARFAALVGAGLFPLGAVSPRDGAAGIPDYATAFPVEVNETLLRRGQERFTIFCAVCHDARGTGNGTIVQRGFTRPPSLILDNARGLALRGQEVPLREVPVGYVFEVITNGFGAMPDYRAQVPPADRWAIVAYVRALQLSQYAEFQRLPPAVRAAAAQALGGTP